MEELFLGSFKWIILIFLAGFIGYFGKQMAKKILCILGWGSNHRCDKIQDKEESELSEKYRYKIEKQKLKLEKKRVKEEGKSLDD